MVGWLGRLFVGSGLVANIELNLASTLLENFLLIEGVFPLVLVTVGPDSIPVSTAGLLAWLLVLTGIGVGGGGLGLILVLVGGWLPNILENCASVDLGSLFSSLVCLGCWLLA